MNRVQVLTDEMWAWIEPLLPARTRGGRVLGDHRPVAEAICWRFGRGHRGVIFPWSSRW